MACGYDFKPLTEEEHKHVKKYNTKYDKDVNPQIRVGPAGYVLEAHFLTHSEEIRNLKLRPDDVFVVSYPRSGTTWTQELVWLIINDLDFEQAKSKHLMDRYQFLEIYMSILPKACERFSQNETSRKLWEEGAIPATKILNAATSQRFIKSHLPLSLLPPATVDMAKVVYVARDMRDVAVSYYHFYKAFPWIGINCEFKEYYQNMFCKNLMHWSPYFEHIKEGWALKDHPNMLFLYYEDLSKDLKNTAKRVADFFGKNYTDKQMDELCDHLAFDNLKNNKSVNMEDLEQAGVIEDKGAFIRRGKAGGWRNFFDEEMTEQAAKWMEEELKGTGINFSI